jgi:hypothetical protein
MSGLFTSSYKSDKRGLSARTAELTLSIMEAKTLFLHFNSTTRYSIKAATHLRYIAADLMHGHRAFLNDGVQELKRAALKRHLSTAYKERPE